jgi:Cytochrome P450
VPSLACKYLQEIENLAAPERRRKEELIKKTLGTILSGELLSPKRLLMTPTSHNLCQLVQTPYVLSLFIQPYSDLRAKTVSSMASLFLALTLYPDVQKRAQAELDVVLAGDRLPTFDDKPRLRYIDALCKELLRWQMVTPLGAGLLLFKLESGFYNYGLSPYSRTKRRLRLQRLLHSERSASSPFFYFVTHRLTF